VPLVYHGSSAAISANASAVARMSSATSSLHRSHSRLSRTTAKVSLCARIASAASQGSSLQDSIGSPIDLHYRP